MKQRNEIPGVQTELVLTMEIFNSFLTIAHHSPLKAHTHSPQTGLQE